MGQHDGFDARDAFDGATSGTGCAASEFKSVLQHITSQISDADRRHSEALQQMQQRLQTLGEQTERARERLPEEFAPAFERIEDRIAQLAIRMSAAPAAVESPQAVPARAQHELSESPIGFAYAAPIQAATIETAVRSIAHQAVAPAPLRSALTESETSDAMASSQRAKQDPFDFAPDSVVPDALKPWDPEQAEALTRIYHPVEESAPQPAPAAAAEIAPTVPAPVFVAPIAAAAVPSVPFAAGQLPEADRSWLEQRFADIAARVEQSLAGTRPNGSIEELDARFNQLEQRLGSALEAVATRSDVEGLRIVEAHINELAAQIEQTRDSLARLDAIEAQIGELMARVSDERLIRLLGSSAPTASEIDAVAGAVAERINASLAPQGQAEPQSHAGSLDEIHRAIDGLVREHREGGEQTATMLDTMQQAMIRMLDRMDALEQVRMETPVAPAPVVSFGAPHQIHSAFDAAPVRGHGLGHAAETPVRQEPHFAAPSPHAADHLDAAPPSVEERRAPAPQAMRGPADDLDRAFDAPLIPAPTAAELRAAEEPARPAQPQVRNREEFVAAARRAMQQAAKQPAVDTAGEPAVAGAPQDPAAGDKPVRKVAAKTNNKSAAGRGSLSPTMMVAAVGLIAIGGAYTVLKTLRPKPVVTSYIERPGGPTTPAEKQGDSTSVAPEVDDDGAAASSTGGMTVPGSAPKAGGSAAEPERRSDDGKPADATEQSARPAPVQRPTRLLPTLKSGSVSNAPAEQGFIPAADGNLQESGRPAGEGLKGITLQQPPGMPSIPELIRVRQQQGMAALSNQVGAAQPPAPVTHAALVTGDTTKATQVASAAPAIEMPPATIGPLSLRNAASRGDASAAFEIGARFAEGKGVQQDFAQAIVWYQRAATQGFAQAQYRLATLHERGLGTQKDLARAKVWYKRAAEQGNVKAMHNLAVLSSGRDGSAPDYAVAVRWFNEAADRGLTDSQYNLGILFENGLGVEKDARQAYKWLALAARGGDKEAARRRDAIVASLPIEQQAVLNAEIETWRAKPADLMANDARAAGEAWKARQPG